MDSSKELVIYELSLMQQSLTVDCSIEEPNTFDFSTFESWTIGHTDNKESLITESLTWHDATDDSFNMIELDSNVALLGRVQSLA